MLARLLPRQIDNLYRGHILGLWLLIPLVLAKLLQGANIAGLLGTGKTRQVLEGVDNVPVSSFPTEAASHLVFQFSLWGLGIFILGLLGVIVLLRYRAMIPLMYVLFLIEQLGRKTLAAVHLERPFLAVNTGAANLINWAFLAVIVIGLLLSLFGRRRVPVDREASKTAGDE